VIDIDQGHSGASAADREGFQHLVAEVSLGRAGIVLGLECSRLARNNADWQRLLQICAHNDTLILDECCPALKTTTQAAFTMPMWGCGKAPQPVWLRGFGGGGAGGCG
jgi:DNA invertase Pin-like site-specific DNA recombinase